MLRLIFVVSLLVFISCGQKSNAKISTINITIEPRVDTLAKPVEVALTFINSYVDNCNKLKKSVEVVKWVNSNKLITTNFKKELKRVIKEAYKVEPDVGLDADPLFDAQDYPEKGFELESFDKSTSFLVLKGKDTPTFKLTMKMTNENSKWLVDGCGMVNIPEDKRSTR